MPRRTQLDIGHTGHALEGLDRGVDQLRLHVDDEDAVPDRMYALHAGDLERVRVTSRVEEEAELFFAHGSFGSDESPDDESLSGGTELDGYAHAAAIQGVELHVPSALVAFEGYGPEPAELRANEEHLAQNELAVAA